jgi:hypothetical protein
VPAGNPGALSQPYNVVPYDYTGTETVAQGFWTATTGTTDPMDWVLIELRDAVTPSTVVARQAAIIREDGRIVALDGTSDISWRTVADGNYFVVINHRNHLGIRSSVLQSLTGTMGMTPPPVYDFTTAQSRAFQDGTITSNTAMKDLSGGAFGLWGGNANSNTTVRASGPLAQNDYLQLVTTTLGGDVNLVLTRYSASDMNMDGTIRASGPLSTNDYLFLINTVLNGNVTIIFTQHQ